MQNLSIEGFSFHGMLKEGTMDIFHQLESIRYRYGLNAVGIWNGFLTSTEDTYLAKIRQALDEKQMTLPSLACDWCAVWADDEAEREKQYRNALENFKAAKILGAKSLRIDWGISRETVTDEEFEFLVNRYTEYCRLAEEIGIVVGPENHFGASLNPDLMLRLIEAINHPSFKILLHVQRWSTGKDTADERLAPHAAHVHVNAETLTSAKLKSMTDAGYVGGWGIEHGKGSEEYRETQEQVDLIKQVLSVPPALQV
ncbi:sugar phosphate isomerase/epimerase [Paenibacillus rhizovicinus]|uniref:Sugar phosphate isomerase/epimerase n=1 Tax=Paenibacillus rhizovicinus TaxID=2704463 RepID=A0A6C0NVL9_9BACL|nr:TIM barrel protein [Paenibacillus rhizovicinus]QHW29783.1 sugar phosphate isomerase/epimerase [Paenibacillus rhizovicinus]